MTAARREIVDLLRFTTAGSVDDGKSTLIGRLLLRLQGRLRGPARRRCAKAATGRRPSTSRCSPTACAPSASRASPSTWPTATSPRRAASSSSPTRPGHEQYTRNMATGASTADLAIILIDARNGVLPQSRRHAFIAALLGIPHLVVAVNKMDLVDFRQEVFDGIRGGVRARSRAQLGAARAALHSAQRAARATTWSTAARACPGTTGPTLLEHLETVPRRRSRATWPTSASRCST